jgi:hypothetical protein
MSKVKEFCSFHDVSIEMDRFLSKGVHFKKWLLSIANYLPSTLYRHRNLELEMVKPIFFIWRRRGPDELKSETSSKF